MSRTTEERIREAEDRAKQALLKVRALRAERNLEQRRLDARRKSILGGWLIAHRPELVSEIVSRHLPRDQDREAFRGWTPSSHKSPPSAPDQAEDAHATTNQASMDESSSSSGGS